jgi:hypothetical protein
MEQKYENMLASSLDIEIWEFLLKDIDQGMTTYGWGLRDTNCNFSPSPTDNGKSYKKSIAHDILLE